MADNKQWLDAGLATLREFGASGLTIERLAGIVGLSKGSFYHHFGGMAGYKTALLSHYEATLTSAYIDAVEQDSQATAWMKLQHLRELVCDENNDQRIEVAFRAWAMQDPETRDAQERIDRRRIDYLRGLWLQVTGNDEQSEVMARLIYLTLIGAGQVLPPVRPDELCRIYDLMIGLAAET